MSNKITITDFLIQLGFDSSEVKKGVKLLEKEFAPLNKKLGQSATLQSKKQKDTNKELKEGNRLTAKRLALQKNIDKLKAKGTTEGLTGLRNSSRSKNIDKVEAARIRSAQMLHDTEKSILRTKEKAARLTAQERVSRIKMKTDAKAMSTAETEDVRRIGFRGGISSVARKLDVPVADPKSAAAIKDIRRELSALNQKSSTAKTRKEFALLREELKGVSHRASLVVKANTSMRKDLRASEFAANSLKDSLRNLSRSYLSLFAIMGATVSFVRTGQELTSLKATLLGVSGTAEGAAKDFDFVSNTAKKLGVDLTEATSAYGKLGAAAKSAGLDQGEARNAFLAATELATAFNLSTSDFEGVSRAMSQILSKGKLSTEELLQLGERVPIAFSSAAKAMGVSTKELFKQIETGAIQSVDFLPDFANEVRAYVRETGMLEASLRTSRVAMNRFVTNYKLNVADAFREGVDSGAGQFFEMLANTMEELNPLFRTFGDILGGILNIVSPFFSALWQIVRIPIALISGVFNMLSDSLDKPLEKMNLFEKVLLTVFRGVKALAAAILYPFAKLEQGLDWLDTWFSKNDNKIQALSSGAKSVGGSPSNISTSAASMSTSNNNNVINETHIQIDGSKNPEDVGKAVQDALDKTFAASFATGY